MTQRKNWIDWLKAFGMVMIVWGHCFPRGGMSEFLYAFNVPLFFIISGYLTKRESQSSVFWRKCWYNLAVPYLILSLLKVAGFVFKHLDDGLWAWSLFGVAFGFHSINGASGCGNLWFVYALIVVKIVYQLFARGGLSKLLLVVLSFAGVGVYHYCELDLAWGVTDALLALPFFMLGNLGSTVFRSGFDGVISAVGRIPLVLRGAMAMFLFVATYAVAQYNGSAYMFRGAFGSDFFLFVVSASLGCGAMLLVSTMLDKVRMSLPLIISTGSLVILTFHRELLHPLLKMLGKISPPPPVIMGKRPCVCLCGSGHAGFRSDSDVVGEMVPRGAWAQG